MKQIILSLILGIVFVSCKHKIVSTETDEDYPHIFPDYIGVTVPSTLAPLNFDINEDCQSTTVKIYGSKTGEINIIARKKTIQIPAKKWEKLLEKNKGGNLSVVVSVITDNNIERKYKPFSIYVSNYPIDYGIAYRLIAPGYSIYGKMGIYERDLSSFKQKTIFENTQIPYSCVNCHSFNQGNPSYLSMHIRGAHGGTVLKTGNDFELLDTKADGILSAGVYPYWHPSGKYIAYSVNDTEQLFHTVSDKRIEVYDKASDIYVYCPKTNEMLTSPLLKSDEYFETFPAFSPDGKTLFFCSAAKKNMPFKYKDLKYSLCSIGFNPDDGSFGNRIDTLFSSHSCNKSVSFPRPSFDGKYLMFTVSDYGNFSIWHKESDIRLLDLQNNTINELSEINSDDSESYHSWSSNSRWVLFTSRRIDGLYTRVYIAGIDEDGNVSKPFLLPQNNPAQYYDELLFSYNVPEFITKSIDINAVGIEKKVLSKEQRKKIKTIINN